MKDESLKVPPWYPVPPRVVAGRSPAEGASPAFTVLIPTYRRPRELRECLDAVLGQTAPPEQVIVIRRDSDKDTARVLSYENAVEEVVVSQGGTVAALCAGLSHASGDVVAVTDDDAVPCVMTGWNAWRSPSMRNPWVPSADGTSCTMAERSRTGGRGL